MAEQKAKSSMTIGRKHSILGKTFRIQRTKIISSDDITKPVNVRHTAHVGASGHNFGDLSFLEPGGRCSKTNGLECVEDYDSPVLTKVKELSIEEPRKVYKTGRSDSNSSSRGSAASDSGHGSSTDPDVSDIASEISSRDVKNDLTEDDISDLTSLDQSIKRIRRTNSCSDLSECSKADYFDFSVDMGPSLLDDVMGTIEQLEVRRTTKNEKQAAKI